MSSASVGQCWGKVEKGPGGTQSLLCCPELFISDPQQSKAPTRFQTRHLDSSLVSKGCYLSGHLGHLICHPPLQSLHPHAVPASRWALEWIPSPHRHIFWDAFRCHDWPPHPHPCGAAHQASACILLWGQLCGHPQITGINDQGPPPQIPPLSPTHDSVSWNSWQVIAIQSECFL